MKIIYCGSHEILEYQEVKLFTEMQHEVFSLGGAYQNSNQGTSMRGPIPNFNIDPQLLVNPGTKVNISEELINWADVILFIHNARADIKDHPQPWLNSNWDKLKKSKKPVVWRSIGQSHEQVEESLKRFRKDGLKIVRYSPKEESIPSYPGSDALIRFYGDPSEFDGYTGQIPSIVIVSQALFGSDKVPSRGDHMNLQEFKQVVEGFDWKVFGRDNEKAGDNNGGKLSYDDLKSMLRFNRVGFYVGTRPASYTLGFIEMFMTGMPIVSIGNDLGNSVYRDQKTFEIPD
ncbi:MAG: hypothetical protein AABY22_04800, partial [Nanoarchaeota archaeon]